MEKWSNYEIMKDKMHHQFLEYDQDAMIERFALKHDDDYIYIRFFDRQYRINRRDGGVTWTDDGFVHSGDAGYNEAMTIYDVLCCSKPCCRASGEFCPHDSLSGMVNTGHITKSGGLFEKFRDSFSGRTEALRAACLSMGGTPQGKADVEYRIPMFDFLSVVLSFWDEDDEFPAQLQIMLDKNVLDFMHYETTWFASSYMLERLESKIVNA
ncbi:MAG: DUF3786 domain-containing protein [Oscillospiraceae bacterium]|nr:DUF3786 domain-containing protein [Oscillospiraceae bacterium]